MKKKLMALSVAVVMILSLPGCGSKNIKLNQRTQTFTETAGEQMAATEAVSGTEAGAEAENGTEPGTETVAETATETAKAVAEVDRGSLNFSESPELSEKVNAGEIPSVESRLPGKNDVFVAHTDATGNALELGEYSGNLNMTGTSGSWGIARPVLESIVRYNTDGSYVPNVIKSFEYNSDYTVWTFHLREGMKWSDGDDFNADDITFWYYMVHINNFDTKASWEALKDTKTG